MAGRPRRVVVIGAGAAGTMAAIFAAERGAETLLLERTPDGGRKILISGGGRCNILPARADLTRFVTDSSPNTLRKMVRSWPLRRADRVLHARARARAGRGARDGQALPGVEPGPRRARRPARARPAAWRRGPDEHARHRFRPRGRPLVRRAGRGARRSRPMPSSSPREGFRFPGREATASASRFSGRSATPCTRRTRRSRP